MKKVFIGIDFSKLKFDATVIKADGIAESSARVHSSFTNDVKGYREFLRWVKSSAPGTGVPEWLFCGEDTGIYSVPLSKHLYGKGYDIWIEDAYRIKHSVGIQRSKSDKADSANIAEYAMRQQDKAKLYTPLSPSLESLREVFLFRYKLVQEKCSLQTRTNEKREVLGKSQALSFMARKARHLIAELEKAIGECDNEMRRLIMEDEELKENFEIITSIKGVALQNATGLIVYTDNFRKFDYDARKIACYYGVAPFGKTSGTSVKQQPHVSKLANRMLKALLSEAAKCAIRFCDGIRNYYCRMVAVGKKHGVAINNVRNKMLHIIVAMVRNKRKYDPCYRLQTINAG
jgi:transposase